MVYLLAKVIAYVQKNDETSTETAEHSSKEEEKV